LQAERPDIAEILTQPIWYFDRKGEVSQGQKGWVQKAVSRSIGRKLADRCIRADLMRIDTLQVFYFHDGKVLSNYDPYFVRSIGRHVEAGLIPGLSEKQKEAIEVFEQTAQRLSLHMVLKVGDIQFVADST
jgi:hypothetical protein